MPMLVIVFAASFVILAVSGAAIAWAIHARAELRAWRKKHGQLTEAEKYAAWRDNRQMIMQ